MGQPTSSTEVWGRQAWIARLYAPLAAVAGVANTPTHSLFSGFRGNWDSQGRATASVQFPAGSNPSLLGTVLGHAVAVTGIGGLGVLASETESFTLLP